MNRKRSKIILTSIVILIIALFVGCSSNKKEEKLKGKWILTDNTSCDFLEDDILRLNNDNTLEGVSDYSEYSLSDDEDINHMIFKGYGDSKRFEYKINESNQLEILEENVSDSLTCTFEKAD